RLQIIQALFVLCLLLLIEMLWQVVGLQHLPIEQVVGQQALDKAGTLHRVREVVDHGYYVRTRAGLDGQRLRCLFGPGIKGSVAHRVGLKSEQVTQRIDDVIADRIGDVGLQRPDQPYVQQARTRTVAALFPEFRDGLPYQLGGAQDIDLGFHVRQRRRNELVAFLAERRADVSLGQLLGLHDDIRTDLEGLLERQRQQQRDQCEQQEHPLDQSPVHEQYSQEVVQIVFH